MDERNVKALKKVDSERCTIRDLYIYKMKNTIRYFQPLIIQYQFNCVCESASSQTVADSLAGRMLALIELKLNSCFNFS